MEKNDDAIVIHLPSDKRRQFELLGELRGMKKSELGRLVIDQFLIDEQNRFEAMKSVFDPN